MNAASRLALLIKRGRSPAPGGYPREKACMTEGCRPWHDHAMRAARVMGGASRGRYPARGGEASAAPRLAGRHPRLADSGFTVGEFAEASVGLVPTTRPLRVARVNGDRKCPTYGD